MQATTKEWVIKTLEQLPTKETEQLIDYLDFLVWRTKREKTEQKKTGKISLPKESLKLWSSLLKSPMKMWKHCCRK